MTSPRFTVQPYWDQGPTTRVKEYSCPDSDPPPLKDGTLHIIVVTSNRPDGVRLPNTFTYNGPTVFPSFGDISCELNPPSLYLGRIHLKPHVKPRL